MRIRPYTLQEAYDKFGTRSYTDVRYKGDVRLFGVDHNGCQHEIAPRELQIDGIVISRGEILVRIHDHNADWLGSNNYAFVTLEALEENWEWPDGSPCGVNNPPFPSMAM